MRTAGPSPVLVLTPAALLMSVPGLPAALLDGQVVDWTSRPPSAQPVTSSVALDQRPFTIAIDIPTVLHDLGSRDRVVG